MGLRISEWMGGGGHGGVWELIYVCRFSVEMSPLNLDRLQQWIQAKRIDPTKPITFKELCESRCLHGIKDGVKLLGSVLTPTPTPNLPLPPPLI